MYSYIPSLIVAVISVIIFLAWAFGTDLYDEINNHVSDDDDRLIFKWAFLIPGTLSTIVWMLTKGGELVTVFCGIINVWLTFWILVLLYIEIVDAFSAFRNYCLSKRGKND
jgi:hypothetical protein